jgi:hypothetical protein
VAMSSATDEDAGLASGLVNTSVQVGGALGLAVLATLSATRTDSLRAAGESATAALTGGYQLAFLIGAGLVALAVVVGLTVLERDPAVASKPERADEEGGEPAYSEA